MDTCCETQSAASVLLWFQAVLLEGSEGLRRRLRWSCVGNLGFGALTSGDLVAFGCHVLQLHKENMERQ